MSAAPTPPQPPARPGPSRPLGRLGAGIRALRQRLAQVPLTPMLLCVLCGLGSVQTLYHMGNGAYRSVTWTQEMQQTEKENAALRRDIQTLEDAKVQLNSPEYLEQMARCWGYVGQNETVLVVSGAQTSTTPLGIGSTCDEYRLP